MAEGTARLPSRCRCGIDVHAHVVPKDFPAYLGRKVPIDWPSMAPAHECHRSVMIDGKLYRTISDKAWTTGKRLADLGAMGLERQAISPMPELLSYWMSAADAGQLLRYINEQIAELPFLHEERTRWAAAIKEIGVLPE